jgi:hypothetical protein
LLDPGEKVIAFVQGPSKLVPVESRDLDAQALPEYSGKIDAIERWVMRLRRVESRF